MLLYVIESKRIPVLSMTKVSRVTPAEWLCDREHCGQTMIYSCQPLSGNFEIAYSHRLLIDQSSSCIL